MQFIAVTTRSPDFTPEQFAEHLPAESRRATELYAQGAFRQIYSRADGKGAVIVIEAADEAEAQKALDSLPLVERGMLTGQIYGLAPYRAFVASLSQS